MPLSLRQQDSGLAHWAETSILMLTKLTKPAPHPQRRMPQYNLSALSIRKVIVCAKSLSRTGQFLKRQTPPVVYTRIKLFSATATTKGFGTSLSTPKFPLHPWQVNKVNPPHIVIGNSAYTVAVSTRLTLTHSHTLQRSFSTKTQVCCQSSNLVYCLQCNICGKQYVGETKRTFHERIREHFRNIRKGLPKEPLGRHFNDADHRNDPSQITAYILAFITDPPNSKDALKMRLKFEFSWIHWLRTSLPMD